MVHRIVYPASIRVSTRKYVPAPCERRWRRHVRYLQVSCPYFIELNAQSSVLDSSIPTAAASNGPHERGENRWMIEQRAAEGVGGGAVMHDGPWCSIYWNDPNPIFGVMRLEESYQNRSWKICGDVLKLRVLMSRKQI